MSPRFFRTDAESHHNYYKLFVFFLHSVKKSVWLGNAFKKAEIDISNSQRVRVIPQCVFIEIRNTKKNRNIYWFFRFEEDKHSYFVRRLHSLLFFEKCSPTILLDFFTLNSLPRELCLLVKSSSSVCSIYLFELFWAQNFTYRREKRSA